MLRTTYAVLGWLAFVTGMIGVLLPVLPTTPFLLLAAALWARSSKKFFVWLLTHKVFGPPIVHFRSHRCIAARHKALAIGMIAFSMGLSIAFVVPVMAGKIGMAVIGLATSAWILSFRTCAPDE